jgi:hypothetical protein
MTPYKICINSRMNHTIVLFYLGVYTIYIIFGYERLLRPVRLFRRTRDDVAIY